LGDDTAAIDPSTIDTTSAALPDLQIPSSYGVADNTISPNSPGAITSDPFSTDSSLPLPASVGPSIYADYPSTVGTEFVSNGDGTYTNIQTGQAVPLATAQEVTAATTGSATANLSTTGTVSAANLIDPTTGVNYSGTLSPAAAALQATGQLATAAGTLTAAGLALAAQGQLIAAPPSTGASVSAALSSLSSWFTGSTLIAGVPNAVILLGLGAVVMILPSMMSGKKRKR
jgi:hypothetical protein